MKSHRLLASFFISILSLSFAQKEPDESIESTAANTVNNHESDSESDLAENEAESEELRFEYYTNWICQELISIKNGTGGTYPELTDDFKVHAVVLDYLRLDPSTPKTDPRVLSFWNDNKDKLICTGTKSFVGRESISFMKWAIKLDIIQTVFGDYLTSDYRNFKIDPNGIEYFDGKPETVLDYIDSLLAEPGADALYDVKELERLKMKLEVKYGALPASELLNK